MMSKVQSQSKKNTEDSIFVGCVVGESLAAPASTLSTARIAELVRAEKGKWPKEITEVGKQTGILTQQAFMMMRALQGRKGSNSSNNTDGNYLFDGALFLELLTKFSRSSTSNVLGTFVDSVLTTWSTMKAVAPNEWWLAAHKVWKMVNHEQPVLSTFYNAALVRNSVAAAATMQCSDEIAMIQTVRHTVATHSHPLYVLCNGLHTFIIRNEHDKYRRLLTINSNTPRAEKNKRPYTIGSVKKWIECVWRPWRVSTEDAVCLAWFGLWSPAEMHQAEHLFLQQFITILSNGDHPEWSNLHTSPVETVTSQKNNINNEKNYFDGGPWETYTFRDALKPFLWTNEGKQSMELCTLTLALSIWCLDWSHSSESYPFKDYPAWMLQMDASETAYDSALSVLHLSGFDTIQWLALLGGECKAFCMVGGGLLSSKYGNTAELMRYAHAMKDCRYLRHEFRHTLSIQTGTLVKDTTGVAEIVAVVDPKSVSPAAATAAARAVTSSSNNNVAVLRAGTNAVPAPTCFGNAIPLPIHVFGSMGAGNWLPGTLYQDSQDQYFVRCPLSWQMQKDDVFASVKAASPCTAGTLQEAVKEFQKTSSWAPVFDLFALEPIHQPHISIPLETSNLHIGGTAVRIELKSLLHSEIKVSLVDSNIINWRDEPRAYDHLVSNEHLHIPLVYFGVSVQFENSFIGRLAASHVAICSFNALKTAPSELASE